MCPFRTYKTKFSDHTYSLYKATARIESSRLGTMYTLGAGPRVTLKYFELFPATQLNCTSYWAYGLRIHSSYAINIGNVARNLATSLISTAPPLGQPSARYRTPQNHPSGDSFREVGHLFHHRVISPSSLLLFRTLQCIPIQ